MELREEAETWVCGSCVSFFSPLSLSYAPGSVEGGKGHLCAVWVEVLPEDEGSCTANMTFSLSLCSPQPPSMVRRSLVSGSLDRVVEGGHLKVGKIWISV